MFRRYVVCEIVLWLMPHAYSQSAVPKFPDPGKTSMPRVNAAIRAAAGKAQTTSMLAGIAGAVPGGTVENMAGGMVGQLGPMGIQMGAQA